MRFQSVKNQISLVLWTDISITLVRVLVVPSGNLGGECSGPNLFNKQLLSTVSYAPENTCESATAAISMTLGLNVLYYYYRKTQTRHKLH